MDWRQSIYNQTNGNVNFGINDQTHDFASDIGHAVGNYATNGLKTEENSIYYTQKKIEKTAAMMSLVIGDFAQRKTIQSYEKANKSYLQSLGIGSTQKQAYFSNMINNATYTVSVSGKPVTSHDLPNNSTNNSTNNSSHRISGGPINNHFGNVSNNNVYSNNASVNIPGYTGNRNASLEKDIISSITTNSIPVFGNNTAPDKPSSTTNNGKPSSTTNNGKPSSTTNNGKHNTNNTVNNNTKNNSNSSTNNGVNKNSNSNNNSINNRVNSRLSHEASETITKNDSGNHHFRSSNISRIKRDNIVSSRRKRNNAVNTEKNTAVNTTLPSPNSSFLRSSGEQSNESSNRQLNKPPHFTTSKVTFSKKGTNNTHNTTPAYKDSTTNNIIPSKGEIQQLISSGSFTRKINGTIYTYSINNYVKEDLKIAYHHAVEEQKHNQHTINATTKNEKIRAVNEYRSIATSHLKNIGVDIGHGTMREVNREIAKLDKIINDSTSSSASVRTARAQRDELIKYKDSGLVPRSDREKTRAGKSGSQNYATHMIASSLLGQDMMTGITFYKRMGNLTVGATRTVLRTAVAASKPLDALAFLNKNNRKNSINDFALHKLNENIKEKSKARKNGTLHEYNQERRRVKRESRDVRRRTKVSERNKKENAIIINGTKKQADKIKRRQQRRDRKDKIVGNIRKGFTEKLGWVPNLRKKLKTFRHNISQTKFMKLVKSPFRFVNGTIAFVGNIKKQVTKFLIIGLGGFLLFCVMGNAVVGFLSYALNFLSGEKDETNYVQMIVDEVSDGLNNEFMAVAKADAENHYLLLKKNGGTPIYSEKYAWEKRVGDGNIGEIYATEDGAQLRSVSANLLPITSMMHTRCFDEINYENYTTAKAYIYYMYVQTHHVRDYSYKPGADHDDASLYKTGCEVTWSTFTNSVNRPTNSMFDNSIEICNNIYVHGYTLALNDKINELRAKATSLFQKGISLLLGDSKLAEEFNGLYEANGVFIDKLPHGPSDGPKPEPEACKHYSRVQWKEEIYYDPNGPEGTNCTLKDPMHIGGCPGLHEHTQKDCYSLTCTLAVHDHSSNCNELACPHVHDASCCHLCANGTEHTEHNAYLCSHTHDSSCCSIPIHTHGELSSEILYEHRDDAYDSIITVEAKAYSKDTEKYCSFKKICSKPYHATHDAWETVGSQVKGCYKTAYYCLGHCGGHITPIININVDMTFEKLIEQDGFKMVHYIANSDFDTSSNGWFSSKKNDIRTVKEWKEHWQILTASWFVPYPSSPSALFNTWTRNVTSFFKNWWEKIKVGISNKIVEAVLGESLSLDDIEDEKDIFDFEGWYKNGVIDSSKLRDLKDIYSDYYNNNYKEGYEAWEDFDVSFPLGAGKSYNNEEIYKIIEEIKNTYPSLNDSRIEVIRTALKSCGQYYYECSDEAHDMGINEYYGKTETSGFVCGVLNRAIPGRSYNRDPKGFIAISSYTTSRIPGDVISKPGIEEPLSGYVGIYVGRFKGPSGMGEYVIDCTSGEGYSALRKVKNLSDVTYCFNPY